MSTARSTLLLGLAVLAGGGIVPGCGGGAKEKRTSQRGVETAPGSQSTNLSDVGKPSVEVIEKRQAEQSAAAAPTKPEAAEAPPVDLPKPDDFTERDFNENDQESRDPFRNYLAVTQEKPSPEAIVDTSMVVLRDYTLAELKVLGVVGGHRRYAMLLDPRTGWGTIVSARDRIARERAVIYEINSDHLVLLVPKVKSGQGEPFERAKLYVDESRKNVEPGSEELRPDEPGIRVTYGRRRGRETPPRTMEPLP